MKKRLLAFMMAAVLAFAVTACGEPKDVENPTEAASGESEVTVGSEVEKFINVDLPSISADREKAVSLYNDYFKNPGSLDSEEWLRALKNDGLYYFDQYLENLNKFEYTTAEVKSLQSTYLQSAQYQRDAIGYVVSGIEEADDTMFDKAEESIAQSETYFSTYEDLLKTVCQDNNITINGAISTSTDAE